MSNQCDFDSLFHVQCVVVIAICALCKGNEDLFTSLGFIVAKQKKAFRIKLNQARRNVFGGAAHAAPATRAAARPPDEPARKRERVPLSFG